MSVRWHLVKGDLDDPAAVEDEADAALERVYVRDGIGPFANKAEVVLDDEDGTKPAEYPRPTTVELYVEVPDAAEPIRRFAGFVQDHATDRNETTLTILSHDFWIRKATSVYADFDAAAVTDILRQLVEAETPLAWDETLVEVENDEEITRRWTGDVLERIFEELQVVSGGDEFFGATFDREFVFRPLEDDTASRSFDVGEYFDTEWTEDGKHAANRAIVRYGSSGEQAVLAKNDRSSQRELQDELGAESPVEVPVQENRPEIEREGRARDKARQLLDDRSELRTGTIETWGAFEVEPGQLASVVDPDQGVDAEFRVVQVEYEWPAGNPPTTVTVADAALDTVDELVDLSDTVRRLELRDADHDAPFLETLDERVGATLEATASVTARGFGDARFTAGFGRDEPGFDRATAGLDVDVRESTADRARVTNAALDAVRDVWQGADPEPITGLPVGSGDASPSRSDTELDDPVTTLSPSVASSDGGAVQWRADARLADDATLRELGVENDALYARVRLPEDVEVPAGTPLDVSLRIAVDTDGEFLGTVEAAGADAVCDVLAADDPATPTGVRFVADDADDVDVPFDDDRTRTRGTGRIDLVGRLEADAVDAETITGIAQIDADGTELLRNDFSPIEVVDFDLEATHRTSFSNA